MSLWLCIDCNKCSGPTNVCFICGSTNMAIVNYRNFNMTNSIVQTNVKVFKEDLIKKITDLADEMRQDYSKVPNNDFIKASHLMGALEAIGEVLEIIEAIPNN